MGQYISLCCVFFYPRYVFTEANLIYKGNNSGVYKLRHCPSLVCKVGYNLTMFIRERRFMEEMKKYRPHENIIQHYPLVIPGHTIMLMERADEDLLEWLKRNHGHPGFMRDFYGWMRQFAKGYRFLYTHHIEHYDIKPDNLLIVNGVLKITDFGTCQINQDRYVFYLGTRGFIAPEIVEMTNKDYYVAHSMDVYSTCIMIMYLQYSSIFKKFYNKEWTLENYLALEKYTSSRRSMGFLKGGLVVDQRYRVSILDLLDYLDNDCNEYPEARC